MIDRLAVVLLDEELRRRWSVGSRLRLRRAWPRTGEHLLLEYVDRDGEIIPAQWHHDPDRTRRVATQTAGASTLEPSIVHANDEELLLQPGGADRRLRALAELLRRPGAELVTHRPERRAVVRLDGGDRGFAKVVRPDRLETLADTTRTLRDRIGGGVAVPDVIHADVETGVLIVSALPGVTMHDLRPDRLTASARAAGTAVAELHGTVVRDAAIHDAAAEHGVVARWVEHATRFTPDHAGRLRGLLPDVVAGLDGPASTTALLHRDLHDKQIMVDDDDGVGLIDLDTIARGEAALDVANLLVHFELRVLQGLWTTRQAEAAAAAFLDGYRPDEATRARLGAYRRVTWLRLACVYAFRPWWKHLVAALADRAGLA